MIQANVILDYFLWKKKINNPINYFNKKLKLLSKMPFLKNKNYEFTIFLTNNKKMKTLNNKFRNKNKVTDVLSFPLNYKINKKLYLGDIAISYELILKKSKKTSFFLEFDKIWVHGYLHLLGYDHKNLKRFKKMSNKEKIVLNYLNKKN
tara:strand:+ start:460 stop:906 length:447 start_codon:yes stop_codon:yes gene_type:complete